MLVSGFVSVSSTIADEVFNTVDASIDTSVEVLNLTTGGSAGSVTYKIRVQSGDGENGCNLDSGEYLTLNVVNGNPAAADVSPSSITFTGPGCNDSQAVTVTPVAVGDSTVSLSVADNTTGIGAFDLATAIFTAHVIAGVPSDITPPVIVPSVSPDANANGWHNGDVTVSWSVSDGESAISDSTGCEEMVLTDETAGTTLICTATSAGGTSSESVTIKIDKTAPVITITSPVDGAHYIRTHTVLADWSASDTLSGLDGTPSSTTPVGAPVDTATDGVKNYTVSVHDLAGNSSSVTVSYIVEPYTVAWGTPATLYLKDFKKTSTIPVKIKLTTSDSVPVAGAVAHLSVGKTLATLVPAVSSGGSNVGDLFRYDSNATQYIFNLTTKMVPSVGTYTLRVMLDDGTQHDQSVVVR